MALTTAEANEFAILSAALLQFRSGTMPSRIVYNGQETDFSKVDLADLKARVQELTTKSLSPRGRTRGAVRFRL